MLVPGAVLLLLLGAVRYRARSRRVVALTSVHEVVEKIQSLLLLLSNSNQIWIGLAGVPGVGKTTLAQNIQQALTQAAVQCDVVPMDGYHYSRAELDQFPDPAEAHRRRGAPHTFDAARFARDLREKRAELSQGRAVKFPTFDHALGDPVEDGMEITSSAATSKQVVLVEGNYLLLWRQELQLDFCFYLFVANLEVAVHRLARRHSQVWNWPMDRSLARVRDSDYANMITVQQNAMLMADAVIELEDSNFK